MQTTNIQYDRGISLIYDRRIATPGLVCQAIPKISYFVTLKPHKFTITSTTNMKLRIQNEEFAKRPEVHSAVR
jgi:hypothetical protein